MKDLSDIQKKILNEIQKNIEVCESPFQVIGQKVGVSEEEVVSSVRQLKQDGVIRQISAIFDTRSLGYESSLVASKVAQKKLEEAAAILNTHPGVSHNYERNHDFNLWYTLAVPPNSRLGLKKTVDFLHALTGAISTRLLPTLRLYKIGVNFDVVGSSNGAIQKGAQAAYTEDQYHPQDQLNAKEIEFVRLMQEDFPVEPRLFCTLAQKLNMEIGALAAMAKDLSNRGKMRRISAVLHHRKAGFSANAMGIWVVPEERCDEIGPLMAGYQAVSHCYRRPSYPDWPYTLFTMVHGKSKEECESILKAISKETGIEKYDSLYSTREFKKIRVRYFTPEIEAWEAAHL